MNDFLSLNRRRDFKRTFDEGRSFAGRYIVVYMVGNDRNPLRIGIPVSKKMGCAVRRNRIKRLIREAFRLSESVPSEGYDIVARPRSSMRHDVKCQAVLEDLCKLMKEANSSFSSDSSGKMS